MGKMSSASGICVSVLSDMAGRMALFVDRTAARWLARLGDNQTPHAREVALLRSLVLGGALGLVILPLALSMVLTPALALPVGAAIAAALFLIVAALVFLLPARVPS